MGSYSKYRYYATSLMTLLTGFRHLGQIMAIFLGRSGALPAVVQLRRTGWRFNIRTAMDAWIIKETCLDADYLWASGPLESDWRILDIGAGLGDFTVFAAKQLPQGVVHAYEPLTESFGLLQKNLALNAVRNTEVFHKGVASQSGSLLLDSAQVEAASTRFSQADDGAVHALALADVLDGLPGGVCDFMKMDCEGCEFDILLNSPSKLLTRIHRISLEYHDGYTEHTPDALADYLQNQGFKVQRRPNPVHAHLGLLYAERLA